jgi:hypothetical protein
MKVGGCAAAVLATAIVTGAKLVSNLLIAESPRS